MRTTKGIMISMQYCNIKMLDQMCDKLDRNRSKIINKLIAEYYKLEFGDFEYKQRCYEQRSLIMKKMGISEEDI